MHAQAQGWAVSESAQDGLEEQACELTAQPLLVLSSSAVPTNAELTDFRQLVIADDPDAVVAALTRDPSRQGVKDALSEASVQLSRASDMASVGASVLAASDLVLDIPFLGEVRRQTDEDAPVTAPWPNLNIYQSLPPRAGDTAEWRLEAFNYPIRQGQEVVDSGRPAIDLTGRVRTLVYGPYTHLVAGRWRARVEVLVDPEGGVAHLWFEWGSGTDCVVVHPSVDVRGLYAIDLDHVWAQSGPAELRIMTLQPHFQGHLELRSVVVERLE